MILQYYGHDLFSFTLADGTVIVTDPYGDFYQYPKRTLYADICTISHHHHDHDSVGMLTGDPIVIDTEGAHIPKEGVLVTGVSTFHDVEQGQKHGQNLVFIIEADGLRLVHLGDLGHTLSAAQIAAIQQPDILLLPVGGNYTIDAKAAVKVMQSLAPKVTIPMHYRTRESQAMPIEPVSSFLSLLGVSPEPMPLCRITAQDISERPRVLLMTTPHET